MANLPFEELAKKGNQYYLENLAPTLEPEHNGEYVVIEVNSGDHYINKDLLTAINEAKNAHPKTLFHIVQVGGVSKTATKKVMDSAWLI